MPKDKIRPERRKRFAFILTMHPRDREVASILDSKQNASEFAKTAIIAWHRFLQNPMATTVQMATEIQEEFSDLETETLLGLGV